MEEDRRLSARIIKAAFSSMGRLGTPSRKEFFARFWEFFLISISKLTVAAYAWSWGFFLVDGEICWSIDTTFSRAPGASTCTLDAVLASGLMASISLIATLFVVEKSIGVAKDDQTTNWTYLLLFFSVSIGDSSWSYWNWLSYSIGNAALGTDQKNILAAIGWASLLGFAINAAFFATVHNASRRALIAWTSAKDIDVWYCDLPFTICIFGAYYGFGPWAVYLNLAIGTTTSSTIAFVNAIGTCLGALLAIVLCYLLPALLWLPAQIRQTEYKDDSAPAVDSIANMENSVEMSFRRKSGELQMSHSDRADTPKHMKEKASEDAVNPLQHAESAATTGTIQSNPLHISKHHPNFQPANIPITSTAHVTPA